MTGVASAQVDQNRSGRAPESTTKENVANALGRVTRGDFSLADVEQLANAGAVQAIPDLKKQFALSHDEVTKGKIASALVKLGDKDDTYWDYLVKEATPAIESDAPYPGGG